MLEGSSRRRQNCALLARVVRAAGKGAADELAPSSFSFCICLSKGSPREHKYMSLGFPRRRGSFGLRCADIFSILSRVRDLSSNAMILLVNHYPKKRAIIMVIILPRPHTHTPHQCPCQGDTPNVSKAHLLGNHFQRKSASLFAFMAVRAHDDDRVGAA